MNRRQRRKRAKKIIRAHVPYAFRDYTPEPIDPATLAAFRDGMRQGMRARGWGAAEGEAMIAALTGRLEPVSA